MNDSYTPGVSMPFFHKQLPMMLEAAVPVKVLLGKTQMQDPTCKQNSWQQTTNNTLMLTSQIKS